jgi:ubiquinone/menaquinone biosynthesis C-methylase UbiE
LKAVESYEYRTLFEYETSYWWFKGLHRILLDTMNELALPEGSKILDAGCGTGQNLVNLNEKITSEAYGFDFSAHAAPFWAKRGLNKTCLGTINDIPFASETFDAVMSVDVFECEDVVEERAYRELWRVLKPQGYLVMVVPAYAWLMTEEHHKAVRASRRYSKSRLEGLMKSLPVELIRITHLFAALLPVVAAYRLVTPYFKSRSDGPPTSELRPLHPALNDLLSKIVNVERHVLRIWNLPFGSSLLAVARKAG